MSRKSEIQNAYKYLGKEATFYDGMITCSTIPGKAVCKVVWNMDKDVNTLFRIVDKTRMCQVIEITFK